MYIYLLISSIYSLFEIICFFLLFLSFNLIYFLLILFIFIYLHFNLFTFFFSVFFFSFFLFLFSLFSFTSINLFGVIFCFLDFPHNFYCHGISIFYLDLSTWIRVSGITMSILAISTG